MKLPRRQFLHLAAGVAALPAVSRAAKAQAYPTRPVRLIVPVAPAGASDITARLMAQWLSDRLGQQFVIENRPGAAGTIAAEAVVKAAPDGYTLLQIGTPNAINATLYTNLSFNFVRDIAPVGSITRVAYVVVVHPSVPAMTIPEFIAYAKANPGRINMASAGNGTPQHVVGELFKMMAGLDMVHVPYRGGGPALNDLLGGQVQIYFPTTVSSIGYIKAGRLRALAVTTATRSDALPDIPTVGEFLPGYARGMASAFPRTHPPRSSTRSTRQLTPASPTPRSRRGSPIWAACRCRCRPPNSASSSLTKPRSGQRW
jgi:tripartite-type tricarboxylate transporter receptor subunit TctC